MYSRIQELFGKVWTLIGTITLSLFILSVIIYGFDINVNQPNTRKKGIYSHLNNERTTVWHFKVDEKYQYTINRDLPEGERVVVFGNYNDNHIPFCFFCGYYKDPYAYEESHRIFDPYIYGDIIYSTEKTEYEWDGVPEGVFEIYDLKKKEFSFVDELSEIGPDLDNSMYRVKEKYVTDNFESMSFFDGDDVDCQIAFGVIFVLIGILIPWGLLAYFILRWRRRKNKKKDNLFSE